MPYVQVSGDRHLVVLGIAASFANARIPFMVFELEGSGFRVRVSMGAIKVLKDFSLLLP